MFSPLHSKIDFVHAACIVVFSLNNNPVQHFAYHVH